MIIRIVREPSQNHGTHGVVFVDGRFFGFSLEDEIREVPGVDVSAWKVAGVTAIPQGRYPLRLALSPRRRMVVPWVDDVPGFKAIQIHPLNRHEESEGCVGIGFTRASDPEPSIGRSREACAALTRMIQSAASPAWLVLENYSE